MNDKTEQSAPNEMRCTAAGGHAAIINVPGCPLMVRAVDYNTLRAQLADAQKDEQRLDWLEAQVNKNGELHLHDGNHARGIGIGLQPGTLARTLRAAIDAAKGKTS